MIIAIDGPMASGKGTIAKAIAAHFNLPFLDTGTLYRATGLEMLKANIDPTDEKAAEAIAQALDISSIDHKALRTAEAGSIASRIAVMPKVRAALFQLQRQFATQPGGAVLDGRDIGTVICPEADVKIYVIADAKIRAARRHLELSAAGHIISLEEMLTQTLERDARDTARADSPMRPADDASLLDTTSLSIDAAIAAAVQLVENRRQA
jgi:cytidylate kinase